MRAKQANLLNFLKSSLQLTVPTYQRTYKWGEKQCTQLWNDILDIGSRKNGDHFLGSIVYFPKDDPSLVTATTQLYIIDGQQRLSTITLILEALARYLEKNQNNTARADVTPQKIREYYLLNHLESEDLKYKLVLSRTDKEILKALISGSSAKNKTNNSVLYSNLSFFEEQINSDNCSMLWEGLKRLTIIDVALERNVDNPQRIFESMNSKGLNLTNAALICNFVLMDLEPDHQDKLFRNSWRPIEEVFSQEHADKFDDFIRYYLTLKTRHRINTQEIYEKFKEYRSNEINKNKEIDEIVKDMHIFSEYYGSIALNKEPNDELQHAFNDLNELKVTVAYPFLLELYHYYKNKDLSLKDFEASTRLIESYAFRRTVCKLGTRSLDKTFAGFFSKAKLTKHNYLEGIKAHMLKFKTASNVFPSDDEFKEAFETKNMYVVRLRKYWLWRIDDHDNNEPVEKSKPKIQIEHIMPQTLSPEWKDCLGNDYEQMHEKYLDIAGNLTLTGYNPTLSNLSFREKCTIKNGYKKSSFEITRKLCEYKKWGKDQIEKRTKELAELATEIWKYPSLPGEIPPDPPTSPPYKKYLESGTSTNRLFDALRKEIKKLDPRVREEFLKRYIAYKLRTNFTDIIPQKTGIKFMLNMKFDDLYDPEKRAKDVRGKGTWGNGEVQVKISKIKDIPYAMKLIRQSFEKQLND